MRAQEAIGQRLILAKQTQEQVLGFDVRASELAGLIPREKNYPACFLGVAFKHRPYRYPLCTSPGCVPDACPKPFHTGTNTPPSSLSIRSQRCAKELLCVTRMDVSA